MAELRPTTVTFAIPAPLERSALPELYRRVCFLLESSGASVAICDVAGVAADAVSIDALARLKLAARRHRCRIEFRHASPELRDLIAFVGLEDVLTG